MSETVERMLPLYQGMMTTFYDHRAADVIRSTTAVKRQNQPRYLNDREKSDPRRLAQPMYWVRESLIDNSLPEWLIAFSDVTSPTNERTFVPVAIPRVGVGHKLPLILRSPEDGLSGCLLACLSSYAVDYLARQKVGGTSMTYFYVRQFPVLPPEVFLMSTPWRASTILSAWIATRTAELVSTAVDMPALANAAGAFMAPFTWDPERRAVLLAELDAAMFHLYGVVRDDVDYIMETFPIVKRKDKSAHGEYRTKRLILEIYDRMVEAICTGTSYESPFDRA